jgi:hypothetical protein
MSDVPPNLNHLRPVKPIREQRMLEQLDPVMRRVAVRFRKELTALPKHHRVNAIPRTLDRLPKRDEMAVLMRKSEVESPIQQSHQVKAAILKVSRRERRRLRRTSSSLTRNGESEFDSE